MEGMKYPEHLVFGLDIGTRSLVGTVGYKENKNGFTVIAQCVKEHETRAMLDGQIHDIPKVTESIKYIKKELEKQIGRKLTEVCIAAAGRVLETITVKADYEFLNESIVTDEHIHSLDLMGMEKAYDIIREDTKEENINFYCVGYSSIHYYLNDYVITNLEGHKANKISVELLSTFLPDEVIDSLYTVVENAGLEVANLTLEPIAAINIAIPEKFRLLNIALIDVGAGTSDISITKDGSIIAYGMIPYAGDEITETIARKYLVEFIIAEKIKKGCLKKKSITYKDIMGISHKILPEEVLDMVDENVNSITKDIAEKIKELNGNKSVSAVFVVGGGGKIPTFVTSLADHLELAHERVALRGAEVLNEIEFLQPGIKKDPLIVTPIGICLNFYDQKNNFIFVHVNDERVKLYDNSKLTIVDAAIQVGFPNEKLFPRRGKPINFTLDGVKRLVRGELGEAAEIMLNGKITGINAPIIKNDKIRIKESTVGADAIYEVRQIPEYKGTIEFIFNGKKIICPKYVMANDTLVSEFYNIQEDDEIKIMNYYTLEQLLEFMDIKYHGAIEVNNVLASLSEKVFENFSVDCELNREYEKGEETVTGLENEFKANTSSDHKSNSTSNSQSNPTSNRIVEKDDNNVHAVNVLVNEELVFLSGKKNYVFVDVLDFYSFDTSVAKGTSLVLKVNDIEAEFTTSIQEGDIIEIYWKG